MDLFEEHSEGERIQKFNEYILQTYTSQDLTFCLLFEQQIQHVKLES